MGKHQCFPLKLSPWLLVDSAADVMGAQCVLIITDSSDIGGRTDNPE